MVNSSIKINVITIISKYLCLMKAWSSQFFWYHQNWNYVNYSKLQKLNKSQKNHKLSQIFIFWYNQNWWFLVKKLVSVELTKWIMWFIYFLYLLWIKYNCAKFHHCGICVTNVRCFYTHSFFIHEQPWKGLFWIRLKMLYEEPSFVSNGFQSNSSFEKKLKQKTILEKWESLFT